MRIAHAVAAATLALALPLTACAEKALEEPELTKNETTSTQAEATTETETVTEQAAETYEDLDPSLFKNGIVGGSSGVHTCDVDPGDDTSPVSCAIKFAAPFPPVEHNGGAPGIDEPNLVWFKPDRGGFITAYSPGHEWYEPERTLEKGQRVTIGDATLTHLLDGGFRVEYSGDVFEVHDGVFSRPGKSQSISEENMANTGGQCGSVEMHGEQWGVYAVQDGTVCDVAMQTVHRYFNAYETGELMGTVTVWDDPENGWGCTGRWVIPGDEEVRTNYKMACLDTRPMSGTKAWEGSGAVAIMQPEDAARL